MFNRTRSRNCTESVAGSFPLWPKEESDNANVPLEQLHDQVLKKGRAALAASV
jgi:hypothetical protein